MKKLLCFFSGLGLLLSLTVHIMSLRGIYLGEKVSSLWILSVGVFVVWFFAVLELIKLPELRQSNFGKIKNPQTLFKIVFRHTPRPVTIFAGVLFLYAIFNFFIFIQSGQGGVADIRDGKYVIHDHGQIVRELNKDEYYAVKASDTRGISGHWMAFYVLALSILWPKSNGKNR